MTKKNSFYEIKIILLLVFISGVSCRKKIVKEEQGTFSLTVAAIGFLDSTRVYLYNRDTDKNIDSSYVINYGFEFSGRVDLPSLCYLFFFDEENNRIDPYKNFYLENMNISIVGNYSDFLNAKVYGSYQTDLSSSFDSISFSSENDIRNLKEIDFLFRNANNHMAISEILYKKKEISKDSLLLFFRKLDIINANSPKGQELLSYAKTIDIKAGDKFRDLVGYDLTGRQHKLSDYSGKVILLDFWAAGCHPCELQNTEEFPNLYNKYNDDEFVIISYSLDTKKKIWREGSERDNIKWLNISDLKDLKGENAKKYAVMAIPNSFIINQNGIVTHSFTGYLKESDRIENEIDRLLKE